MPRKDSVVGAVCHRVAVLGMAVSQGFQEVLGVSPSWGGVTGVAVSQGPLGLVRGSRGSLLTRVAVGDVTGVSQVCQHSEGVKLCQEGVREC